jgi:class 3 adenylate cyclase/DNA-binding winged helix-turn-helix (wHTH) protein
VRTRRSDTAKPSDPGALDLRLLGPLEVRRDGVLLKLGGAKPRTLLADLALHLGEAVSVDRLIDDLWGETPPESAPHAVEVHVSRLRKELGAALVTRDASGYALVLEPEQLDLTRFARRASEARALSERDPERAAEILREALALWRGPALAEFAFEPFAQGEIGRLEELRSEALELRIDCELQLGRTDLVSELQSLVAAEPLRERLREQLMLALYLQGRQADALAEYRAARSLLMEELGVEPNPSLRALEAAILRQDATLTLPVRQPAQAQRKLATILFADLADSTGLAVSLDPETWRAVQRRYFDAVAAAVARHGGTTEKYVGDAVMAVFGTPVAHEDDALRAARAAVETRDAVAGLEEALERELGIRLEVRVGLATGEVLSGGSAGDPLATGPAVNVAVRLQQEISPGEIAVDELTRRLTGGAGRFSELGALELRGLRRPVHAFRLDDLVEGAAALPRRLDAPLVGRELELAVLRDAFAAAVSERALRAVTVSGPAGIGKSRLADELIDGMADDAIVLQGRCLSYGESAPFGPLRDALVSKDAVAAALEGTSDARAIATGLEGVFGGDATVPADAVPWAFRRYLETLAARQPVVVALDDLHWAEPALLDLVEHFAASSREVPILLVCVTREELAEERPEFLLTASQVALKPLTDRETGELVNHLLPDSVLDDETRGRLIAAAEGNPLFLEQLVAHVGETGLLEPPPTLRALLAARLDRLGPGERGVLERAAVVGREFTAGDVKELLDGAVAPTAPAHLETLVRRGFVQLAVETGFRFRHGLIHDAVYRGAPKELRAALHERFADHLDRNAALDELVGFHLERAYRLHVELGEDDRRLRQLAADAGARLGRAGMLAWKRNDVHATVGLLERATALLPAESSLARELTCELGLALRAGGDGRRATDALALAARAASSAGDAHIELRAGMELSFVRLLEEPAREDDALLALAERAIPTFEALKNDRALGRALLLAGYVHGGRHLRCKEQEEAAERALASYRRAGWPVATCVGQLSSALYKGPTPAEEAVARCEALLAEDASGPAEEANVLVFLGGLLAMLGRFDDGRRSVARARAVFDELGQAGLAALSGEVAGGIELLAGVPAAAEQILLESCESLQRARLHTSSAACAGGLAAAFYAQGRYSEADEWSTTAESAASRTDLDARLAWEPVRAKLLARRGEHQRAERLARASVAVALGTDALNQRARTLLDLGEVMRLAGRESDAAELVEQARREYESKGNLAGVDHLASPVSA